MAADAKAITKAVSNDKQRTGGREIIGAFEQIDGRLKDGAATFSKNSESCFCVMAVMAFMRAGARPCCWRMSSTFHNGHSEYVVPLALALEQRWMINRPLILHSDLSLRDQFPSGSDLRDQSRIKARHVLEDIVRDPFRGHPGRVEWIAVQLEVGPESGSPEDVVADDHGVVLQDVHVGSLGKLPEFGDESWHHLGVVVEVIWQQASVMKS